MIVETRSQGTWIESGRARPRDDRRTLHYWVITRLWTAIVTVCEKWLRREAIVLTFVPCWIRGIIMLSNTYPTSCWRRRVSILLNGCTLIYWSSFKIVPSLGLTRSQLTSYMLTWTCSSSLKNWRATYIFCIVLSSIQCLIMRRIAHQWWVIIVLDIRKNHRLRGACFTSKAYSTANVGIIDSCRHLALSSAAAIGKLVRQRQLGRAWMDKNSFWI